MGLKLVDRSISSTFYLENPLVPIDLRLAEK